MKTRIILLLFCAAFCDEIAAQTPRLQVKPARFRTTEKVTVDGIVGTLTVPENRRQPGSRSIAIKFIRLKSLSPSPGVPVIYLEGGGNTSTWQAQSPKDLTDWLPILRVSDVIFVDQRGTADEELTYVWRGDYPPSFLVSEQAAGAHYQEMCRQALLMFGQKGIDVSGYTVEEHATDIHELAAALQIGKYSLFGFSFGTHIGMAILRMFPGELDRAVLIGADALDQSFNYPHYLDEQLEKLSALARMDSTINADIVTLTRKVMDKLATHPVTVAVKHPLTGKKMDVQVGPFGLALILRLDIDDTNDIPALTRLLHQVDAGDYSMLEWFVQRRIAFAFAVPGNGINQALASGLSNERQQTIAQEASKSIFGNVVNFPFYDARTVWPESALSFPTTPIVTDVPTLFVTGSLDCRTPVQQVEEARVGFSRSVHLVVKNAGHEQAMWDTEVFDEAIPAFLQGKEINKTEAFYKEIKFLPLAGPAKGHPSIK